MLNVKSGHFQIKLSGIRCGDVTKPIHPINDTNLFDKSMARNIWKQSAGNYKSIQLD